MGQPLSFSFDFMAEGKPAVKAFSGQRTQCTAMNLDAGVQRHDRWYRCRGEGI
ncbi:MAG: hypothetical protein ACM3N3_04330 [Betaproteobacteria bacterium]